MLTIDELDSTKATEDESSSDDDIEEALISPPTFKEAISYVEAIRNYFICHETEQKTFQQLNFIQNAVIETQRSSSHQTTVMEFFSRCSK